MPELLSCLKIKLKQACHGQTIVQSLQMKVVPTSLQNCLLSIWSVNEFMIIPCVSDESPASLPCRPCLSHGLPVNVVVGCDIGAFVTWDRFVWPAFR